MAWSVNDIMNFFKFQLRKNQAGAISATDLFYAWNSEQSSYHQDLLGRWQARSNGKTGVNTGLVQNEAVLLEIAPFTLTATLTFAAGLVSWPTDLLFTLAIRPNGHQAIHFRKDQRDAIETDPIDPPSIANNQYYFTEYAGQFLILPAATPTAEIDYIGACRDIVWAFTFDVDNRQVYDPVLSVQPVWTQNTIITICKRTLASFGISFKDQDFEQAGKSNITTGDN